jgi:hypothetical protein
MPVRVRREVLDFIAQDYLTKTPKVKLCLEGDIASRTQERLNTECILRWYVSLQGEDRPRLSQLALGQDGTMDQHLYRYDWSFGVTLLEGFYWDWQGELRKEGALAIHVVLQPLGETPEAVPVSATVSALSPSRNSKGFWELAWPKVPAAAAELAKAGETVVPALKYIQGGLALTSNVLASQAAQEKNWFLYQFLDEKRKAPTVEWRINRVVLKEYGPLLRGSLWLAFYGAPGSKPGAVRVMLRPQMGYCEEDHLCFIVPTAMAPDGHGLYIDVSPRNAESDSA